MARTHAGSHLPSRMELLRGHFHHPLRTIIVVVGAVAMYRTHPCKWPSRACTSRCCTEECVQFYKDHPSHAAVVAVMIMMITLPCFSFWS